MSINEYQSDEAFHSGMEDERARLDPCEAIGKRYRGFDGFTYLCESYDPSCGYWVSREDGSRRANISERAIGRTYHEIRS
jgi:hypothetical protein